MEGAIRERNEDHASLTLPDAAAAAAAALAQRSSPFYKGRAKYSSRHVTPREKEKDHIPRTTWENQETRRGASCTNLHLENIMKQREATISRSEMTDGFGPPQVVLSFRTPLATSQRIYTHVCTFAAARILTISVSDGLCPREGIALNEFLE